MLMLMQEIYDNLGAKRQLFAMLKHQAEYKISDESAMELKNLDDMPVRMLLYRSLRMKRGKEKKVRAGKARLGQTLP